MQKYTYTNILYYLFLLLKIAFMLHIVID